MATPHIQLSIEPFNHDIKQHYATKSSKIRISISRLFLLELQELISFIHEVDSMQPLSALSSDERNGKIIIGSTILTQDALQSFGTICHDLAELTKIQPQIIICAKRPILLEILDVVDFIIRMVLIQANIPWLEFTIKFILHPIHFVFSTTPSLFINFSRLFTPLVCQLITLGYSPIDSRIICVSLLNEMSSCDGLFHSVSSLLVNSNTLPSNIRANNSSTSHQNTIQNNHQKPNTKTPLLSPTRQDIPTLLNQSREVLLPLYTQLIEPYIQPLCFTMTLTFDLRLLVPLINVILKLVSLFFALENISASSIYQQFVKFQNSSNSQLLPSELITSTSIFHRIFLLTLSSLQIGLFRVNQRIFHRSMAQLQVERNFIQFPSTLIDTNYINDSLEDCVYLACEDIVYIHPTKEVTKLINSSLSCHLLPIILQRAHHLRIELLDYLCIQHTNGVLNQHCEANNGADKNITTNTCHSMNETHFSRYYRTYIENDIQQNDDVHQILNNLTNSTTIQQLIIKDYHQTTQSMSFLFALLNHTNNNVFQQYPFNDIIPIQQQTYQVKKNINEKSAHSTIFQPNQSNNETIVGYHDVLHTPFIHAANSKYPPTTTNPILSHLSILPSPQLNDRPGILIISLPTNQILLYQPWCIDHLNNHHFPPSLYLNSFKLLNFATSQSLLPKASPSNSQSALPPLFSSQKSHQSNSKHLSNTTTFQSHRSTSYHSLLVTYKSPQEIHHYFNRIEACDANSFPQHQFSLSFRQNFLATLYNSAHHCLTTQNAPAQFTHWTDLVVEHTHFPHIILNPSYISQSSAARMKDIPSFDQLYLPHHHFPTFQLFHLVTNQLSYCLTIPKIQPHLEFNITLPRWNPSQRSASLHSKLTTSPYYYYLNQYILPTLTHPHPHTGYLTSLISTITNTQPLLLVADFRYFPANYMDGECINKILFDPSSALTLEQVYLFNWFVIGVVAKSNSYLHRCLETLSLLALGMAGYDETGIGPEVDFCTKNVDHGNNEGTYHIDTSILQSFNINSSSDISFDQFYQNNNSNGLNHNNISSFTNNASTASVSSHYVGNRLINNQNASNVHKTAGINNNNNFANKQSNDSNHRMTQLILQSLLIQHQISNQLAENEQLQQQSIMIDPATDQLPGNSTDQPNIKNQFDPIMYDNLPITSKDFSEIKYNNDGQKLELPIHDYVPTLTTTIHHSLLNSPSGQDFTSNTQNEDGYIGTDRPKSTMEFELHDSPLPDELINRALKSPLALLSPQQLAKILSPNFPFAQPLLSVSKNTAKLPNSYNQVSLLPTSQTPTQLIQLLIQSSLELTGLKDSIETMTYEQLYGSIQSVIDQFTTRHLQLIHLIENLNPRIIECPEQELQSLPQVSFIHKNDECNKNDDSNSINIDPSFLEIENQSNCNSIIVNTQPSPHKAYLPPFTIPIPLQPTKIPAYDDLLHSLSLHTALSFIPSQSLRLHSLERSINHLIELESSSYHVIRATFAHLLANQSDSQE